MIQRFLAPVRGLFNRRNHLVWTHSFSSSCFVLSSCLPNKANTLAKFDFPLASHTIPSISSNIDRYLHGDTIVLNGHLHRKPRIMAKNSFAELRDSTGYTVQLILSPDTTPKSMFDILKASIPEESISVTGYVKEKQVKQDQDRDWELLVTNYQVLNASNLDAARLDKLKHLNPHDLPPHFRYLQLRDSHYQKTLKTRSMVANIVRGVFINDHDFTEIETPLLFKSTPEGAREFLVPTRSHNSFYALPQSPQQYKQLLMSSGFTKYFQIAKCFRDEDLRSDRQPEFTQIDFEMSFITSISQITLVVEDLIKSIWSKVVGIPVYIVNEKGNLQQITENQSFTHLTYSDALSKCGIDKPDLRSSLEFHTLLEFFVLTRNPQFPVIEACVLDNAFNPNENKFKIPKVLTDQANYSRRKPIVIPITSETDAQCWYDKFIDKQVLLPTSSFDSIKLQNYLNLKPGDILAFSDRAELPYENPTPLGKFRQLAMATYPKRWDRKVELTNGDLVEASDDIPVASWIVDFPLFSPKDVTVDPSSPYPSYDFTKLESNHHPFTMVKVEDYDLLESDPLNARGEHYDLVINGVEVGGGSRRIHDSQLQQYIFEHLLNITNYNDLFGHLLHALSMGCPPHAGLAIGFDRLCAMISGCNSIRDVIAFPKNQSGVDPVVESPSSIKESTLNEYFITTTKN